MAKQPEVSRESDLDIISQKARDKFLDGFRGPTVEKEVEIGAAPIQGHYKRYYYHTLNNAHIALVVGRANLEDDKINAVEKLMLDRISKVADLFKKREIHADTLLEHNQVEGQAINRHASSKVRVIVVGPVARRYLDLILQADKLYAKYALMWTEGEIPGDEFDKNVTELKNRLKSVVVFIEQTRNGVLGQINAKNKGSEAAAPAHSKVSDGESAASAGDQDDAALHNPDDTTSDPAPGKERNAKTSAAPHEAAAA